MNRDYLLTAIDADRQVRIFAAHTTGVVEEARLKHHTSPTASAALGRILTAALILAGDLKNEDDIITLKVEGDGTCGPIIASADARGYVRGMISEPAADVPPLRPGKLAVGNLVGNHGFIEVIKDLGLKQPFIGKVPLVSGEIAEDLAQYYLLSEQIPSLVALGVLVAPDLSIQAAGGIVIQAMPGASENVLKQLEDNISKMGGISQYLSRMNAIEDVLNATMQGLEYQITGEKALEFHCTCNWERLKIILAGLTEHDIEEICETTGMIEVRCNFCNELYYYEPEEILAMKNEKP